MMHTEGSEDGRAGSTEDNETFRERKQSRKINAVVLYEHRHLRGEGNRVEICIFLRDFAANQG